MFNPGIEGLHRVREFVNESDASVAWLDYVKFETLVTSAESTALPRSQKVATCSSSQNYVFGNGMASLVATEKLTCSDSASHAPLFLTITRCLWQASMTIMELCNQNLYHSQQSKEIKFRGHRYVCYSCNLPGEAPLAADLIRNFGVYRSKLHIPGLSRQAVLAVASLTNSRTSSSSRAGYLGRRKHLMHLVGMFLKGSMPEEKKINACRPECPTV